MAATSICWILALNIQFYWAQHHLRGCKIARKQTCNSISLGSWGHDRNIFMFCGFDAAFQTIPVCLDQ